MLATFVSTLISFTQTEAAAVRQRAGEGRRTVGERWGGSQDSGGEVGERWVKHKRPES